jgi:hypothetical protein
MRPPSSHIAPLGLLLLAACSAGEPPPGEAIGTFAFVATLEPADGPDRCAFDGAPARIAFDGGLSRDPETGAAWLQIDGTLREGWLEGAAFELGLPVQPDGSTRLVPRQLRACTCTLGFAESLAGTLVPRIEDGCETPPAEEPLGIDTCPRLDEEGELSWDTCGGACGTLVETVRPTAPCTCVVDDMEVRAPDECRFVYRLEGRRIGG